MMHTHIEQNLTAQGMNIPGLKDPVHSSVEIFRLLTNVMSKPGSVEKLPDICGHPENLSQATAAVLLSLADMDTSLYLARELDHPISRGFLTLHTGVKMLEAATNADFVLATQETDIAQYQDLPVGDPQYPDQSATLILQVNEIQGSKKISLSGPGIKDKKTIMFPDLTGNFFAWREMKNSRYPCGIDVIFASSSELMAIPRTTKLEE